MTASQRQTLDSAVDALAGATGALDAIRLAARELRDPKHPRHLTDPHHQYDRAMSNVQAALDLLLEAREDLRTIIGD